MSDEARVLEENRTWVLEDLPPGKKHVHCKWVYRIKYKYAESIERYKAHLVIQGDHQIKGRL